jgi:FtsP/CotA-like multicopper oxidase with cupredoxin domain
MRQFGWSILLALAACSPGIETVSPPPDETPEEQAPDAGVDAGTAEPTDPPIWGATPLEDSNPDPRIVEVSLTAKVAPVKIGGQTVSMYTYNGQFPGPLLFAHAGDRVIVHFTNQLPEATTVHWHGLRIPDAMDGSPRIQSPVPPAGTFTYDFVVPEAGSFWYHPHVRANEQIEKGLYGPIVVRGAKEPAYDVERYLVLDDILLDGAGNFVPFMSGMEAMHGRFGNQLLTNGKPNGSGLNPPVAGRVQVERWRLVNTSNARTMELSIKGASFRVIGTDGGLLEKPYTTSRLTLPVGQRYDLEVILEEPGTAELLSWVLVSDGNGGAREIPITVFTLDVGDAHRNFRAATWTPAPIPNRVVDGTATLTFDAVNDPQMGLMWRINGESHPEFPLFTFTQGQTVRMRLVNKVMPEHPFHLHGQFFRVENDASQPGLKDTVLVGGGQTVEITAFLDNPGRWMAHCHILEHAELGMMAEYVVKPKAQ